MQGNRYQVFRILQNVTEIQFLLCFKEEQESLRLSVKFSKLRGSCVEQNSEALEP